MSLEKQTVNICSWGPTGGHAHKSPSTNLSKDPATESHVITFKIMLLLFISESMCQEAQRTALALLAKGAEEGNYFFHFFPLCSYCSLFTCTVMLLQQTPHIFGLTQFLGSTLNFHCGMFYIRTLTDIKNLSTQTEWWKLNKTASVQ